MTRWNRWRLALGLVAYGGGALLHILLGLSNPGVYRSLGETALLPFYRDLFATTPIYGAQFPLLLAGLHLIIGLLILHRGVYVRWGSVGGIVLQALFAPVGWWGFLNIGLVVVQAMMLAHTFDDSWVEWVLIGRERQV